MLGPIAGVLFIASLLAAAVIDARERRFPNHLALAALLLGSVAVLLSHGPCALVVNLGLAACASGSLVAFEVLWRALHGGGSGIGMGDVKALAAMMSFSPVAGLGGFCVGLLGLAVFGVVARKRSLPLLPFAVPGFLLALLAVSQG